MVILRFWETQHSLGLFLTAFALFLFGGLINLRDLRATLRPTRAASPLLVYALLAGASCAARVFEAALHDTWFLPEWIRAVELLHLVAQAALAGALVAAWQDERHNQRAVRRWLRDAALVLGGAE